MLLFDDSFEHEAWWGWTRGQGPSTGAADSYTVAIGAGLEEPHKGTEASFRPSLEQTDAGAGLGEADERVVLIVDVWHPELTGRQRERLRETFASRSE